MRPMFVADGWRDNKPSCIPATWHLCVEKKEGRGSQRQCGQRRGTGGRNLLVTGNWHSYWLKHHYIKMIICTGCKLEPLLDPWIQKSIWHPFDGAGIYYYIFINIIYIYTNIYQQIQQLLVIYSHHPRHPPVASRADLVKEVLPPFFEPGIARATWAKSLWLGFDESNVFLSNVVLFSSYWVFIDLLFVSNRWIYCIMEFFYFPNS
jgi:hypothetical protein